MHMSGSEYSVMHARKFNAGVANAAHQRGAVLFVALMFLVIIALLAVTSSGTSIMEERMTGGMRNRQLATMAAETALRAGERSLWTAVASGNPILACGGQFGGAPLFNVYCYDKDDVAGLKTFRTSKQASTFAVDSAKGRPLSAFTGAPNLAAPVPTADLTSKVAANPYVLIQDLGPEGDNAQHDNRADRCCGGPPPKHLYRVTARSVGGTDTVMRVLETTFAAP